MKRNVPWNLIIAKFEGNITSSEEDFLETWLSDSGNLRIYEEVSALWQKVQARTDGYVPDPAFYWEQVAKKLNLPSVEKKPKRMYGMKLLYRVAACIAILLVSSLALYYGIEGQKDIREQYYTNVNGKSQVTLPDGTVVWLHANTTLSYKTDFRKENRLVALKGEAYFEVAKDKKKRFIVHTEGVDIAVYGTKFNVLARPGDNEISVSLLSGSVAFTTKVNPKERFLIPGESALYNKVNHNVSITQDEVNMNAAWATPVVEFNNQPLQQICDVFSKRFNVNIELAPELVDKYKYTFTLRDENLTDALDLISTLHSIKYSFSKDGSICITQ